MKYLLPLIALVAGCSSLDQAGVSEYRVKPFIDSKGDVYCCDVDVRNGKQMASVDAVVIKDKDKYTVIIQQRGVEAFTGQASSANVLKDVVNSVTTMIPGVSK